LILGLTLHSTPAEIYRTLIEGTAFGAKVILQRFEEYGVAVERVVNCGGIAQKDPLFMQIYADVLNKEMEISKSTQTGALGSAIAGSVVAGNAAGGYDSFDDAIEKMTGILDVTYTPIAENVAVYQELFELYKKLHDAFGTEGYTESLGGVMKDLLRIRDRARS
jgi:L-ribulokinase